MNIIAAARAEWKRNRPTTKSEWRRQSDQRNGVLLLVVLSMLTLFLMLGAAYLVVSTRSRETARAFARLAMQSESIRISPDRLLDSAFLTIVRGGDRPFGVAYPRPPLVSGTFESLLADKYGSSTTGTVTSVTVLDNTPTTTTPLLSVSGITGVAVNAYLPGRVVTLLGAGREPTSHRIVKVDPGNGSLVLDNPARRRPFALPSGTIPFVLNGPEFSLDAPYRTNEPWDAFDDDNPFLTHLSPKDAVISSGSDSVSSSVVKKIGYLPLSSGTSPSTLALLKSGTNGFSYGADNDGDGEMDGFFFDVGLPSQYAANGDEIRLDVSALVVDLDSRFNVNAHGSLAAATYLTNANNLHRNWARTAGATTVPQITDMPLGSGYGPAEVNAGWMFPSTAYTAPTRYFGLLRTDVRAVTPLPGANPDIAIFSGLVPGSQIGKRPSTTRFSSGNDTPRIGTVEGRYGEAATGKVSGTNSASQLAISGTDTLRLDTYPLARPGQPMLDDTLSTITDRGVNAAVVGGTVNAGIPPLWWSGTTNFDWSTANTTGLPSPRGTYNSPPDLHGRMITTSGTATGKAIPQLVFAKPEWGSNETTDDPYELRLDRAGPRNGLQTTSGTNIDNVFNVAEMEAVLRPYDRDSMQLPLRLQVALGTVAEEARLRVTTDSWDTTAITGTAATNIRKWAQGAITTGGATLSGTLPLSGLLSGEIARGERFNLNRFFAQSDDTADARGYPADWNEMRTGSYHIQRQAYFKDLYTLLVALGRPADSTTAQWAANIVEFRDADSRVMPFEYDTQPQKGWNVDGFVSSAMSHIANEAEDTRKVVWGAERPEILLQEVFAWRNSVSGTGGMVINLHRPWNAIAYSTGTTNTPAEPCDLAFDTLASGTTGRPLNRVDLGKKTDARAYSGTNSLYSDFSQDTYPIWRLRLVAGGTTSYVRFDSGTATGNEIVLSDLTPASTGDDKPKMGVDSTLTIASGTAMITGAGPTQGTAYLAIGPSVRPAANLQMPGTATSGTVYLERISDPTQSLTTTGTVPGTNKTGRDIWEEDPLANIATTTVPVRYLIVDQSPVTVVETSTVSPSSPVEASTSQRKPPTPFWRLPTASSRGNIVAGGTITIPNIVETGSSVWFPWPNRPFVSSAELYLVPEQDAAGMLQSYVQPTSAANLPAIAAASIPAGLFDAVHVPTRFAGIHTTTSPAVAASLATAGIYPVITPVNQLSSFREPGRVNLNTVSSDDVWAATVAGPLQDSGTASPVVSRAAANFSTTPATGMHALLALSGSSAISASGTTPPVKDSSPSLAPLQELNPIHTLYTATRLANTATTRSNVFGIWITLRESVLNDPDSIKLHRAFYIFDRSIPVGFEPGKDHNVWDAVLLRRIIE
jgi:hypothetical protein